jgi:AcrR family transcriptional regulator
LTQAASRLLDLGGDAAVTLRAVGQAAGVSHNAPYKHFENRLALLASVAMADAEELAGAVRRIRASDMSPRERLMETLMTVARFGREHPSRYRLLFEDPAIAALEGPMKQAAMATFAEFAEVVRDCQTANALPAMPHAALTGLIFASLHGLISLSGSGRMQPGKGLIGVNPSIELLLDVLAPAAPR